MNDSSAGNRNPGSAIIPFIDEALDDSLYSPICYLCSLLHCSEIDPRSDAPGQERRFGRCADVGYPPRATAKATFVSIGRHPDHAAFTIAS